MKHLQEVLQRHSLIDCRPRYSLTWSAGKREELARIARNEIKPIVPIDVPLATHLLKCADGGFTEAEPQIIDLLRQNIDRCLPDNETFISLLNAVFVLQRFDIVAAMLRDRYGFTGEFGIDATDTGLGIGQIQWDISPSREHRFIFDAECFGHDNTRLEIMAFQWEFPLFANYSCGTGAGEWQCRCRSPRYWPNARSRLLRQQARIFPDFRLCLCSEQGL